jgi:hypothetical protein
MLVVVDRYKMAGGTTDLPGIRVRCGLVVIILAWLHGLPERDLVEINTKNRDINL